MTVLPALVLTAGLGTRLDPLTRLLAKPAVPIAGRTLIERVLHWLRHEGVTDVVLNLHHRPATVTAVVGDGAHLGLRVRYSWEYPILGSAGGPRHALPLMDAETFLIVNGDTLCEIDLAPMIAAHAHSGASVTLALVPNPAPDHYNGVVLDGEDRIHSFVPKGQAQGTWHFVGVQVVNAEAFAGLADGAPAETIAGLYREMADGRTGNLRGWRIDKPFVDVGTPRDYWRAVLGVAGGQPADNVVEGTDARIDPSARLVRSVVWDRVRISAGADLEDCVVAGDLSLPANFVARSSVVVPASIVGPGEPVKIIGDAAIFPL